MLELTIVSAESLKKTPKMLGKKRPAPYAVAWLDPQCKKTTKPSPNSSSSAHWNETLCIPMSSALLHNPNAMLIIQLLTPNTKLLGAATKILGTATLPTSEIARVCTIKGRDEEETFTLQLWRPSGRAQGTLKVSLKISGVNPKNLGQVGSQESFDFRDNSSLGSVKSDKRFCWSEEFSRNSASRACGSDPCFCGSGKNGGNLPGNGFWYAEFGEEKCGSEKFHVKSASEGCGYEKSDGNSAAESSGYDEISVKDSKSAEFDVKKASARGGHDTFAIKKCGPEKCHVKPALESCGYDTFAVKKCECQKFHAKSASDPCGFEKCNGKSGAFDEKSCILQSWEMDGCSENSNSNSSCASSSAATCSTYVPSSCNPLGSSQASVPMEMYEPPPPNDSVEFGYASQAMEMHEPLPPRDSTEYVYASSAMKMYEPPLPSAPPVPPAEGEGGIKSFLMGMVSGAVAAVIVGGAVVQRLRLNS